MTATEFAASGGSFLDLLRTALNSAKAQWNTFLMTYKPDGRTVFAFVEGKEDLAFYGPLLSSQIPSSFVLSFVKCNSKEGVLATLKEFKSLYQPNPRAMFFVDRDHDDLVGEQPDAYLYLFVTDGYSIENELCSDSVVRRHCVETLGLDSQHVAVERAVGQFGAAFGSFEEAVRMPMAWIVAARRKGKVNIRNVVSKTLLYFDSEKMRVTLASSWDDSVAYLCRVTGDNGPHPGVSGDELDSAQRDMAMVAPKVWMRGKQCVWFCVQFLNAIAVSFRAVGLFEKVHRLDEANAIQDLAPRVSPSATLRSFLERVVQALVNP